MGFQVARESQRSAVFETLNDRTNDVRTMLPQARRQQFDNFSPVQQQQKPIINRRLPIRPTATTPRPAQPIQPAQPAQFASQSQQDALRQHEFDLQQVLRQQQQQQGKQDNNNKGNNQTFLHLYLPQHNKHRHPQIWLEMLD